MLGFAERLVEVVKRAKTPLCVGLDPRWDQIPLVVRQPFGGAIPDSLEAVALAYEIFCGRVLELVAGKVGVVKFQAAFFEQCGSSGFAALERLLNQSRALGLFTIQDGKRNDIASTATAYAEAAFGGPTFGGKRFVVDSIDAITVNPYLGTDAVEPFLQQARSYQGGIFILVRTSNPGAGLFQDLLCPEEKLYRHVAKMVESLNRGHLEPCGYGDVGAVVGATYPAELAELRHLMPNTLFLVPGFGAQGASAGDLAGAFRHDGTGAVINSGRAITFAAKPDQRDWETQLDRACEKAKGELAGVCAL